MTGRVGVALVGALLLAACEFAPVTPSPATPIPSAAAEAPSVSILSNWTFSGGVDPNGSPTRVVLEIGPGPQTSRVFNQEVVAVEDVIDAGPVSVAITPPDAREFCVRFTATNEVGSGSTPPLCVSTDLPGRT